MRPGAAVDVVVVGGGHNGLVAAAYLARAGRSVLVLERRAGLGGAAVSEQVFPSVGVRLSAYSYLVSLLPDRLVADLDLGLELRDRAVSSATLLGDRALLVERDPGPATEASFRALTGSDAEWAGWQRFYGRLSTLAEDLSPTLVEPLLDRGELEGRLRDPQLYRDLVERPLADVVADHLHSDVARGVALTDGLIGTFADVHAADGLAGRCFLYHLVGNGTGLWRVPVGGMGVVSGAIADAARRAGADLRTRATVTAVETRAEGVTVHWTDDEGAVHAVDAGHVVAGCAPAVLDELTGAAPGPRPEGAQLKVNMVLTRLPRTRSGLDPAVAFGGTCHVDEAASQIDAAYAQAAAGTLPGTIPFEVYCHSLTDPSITGGTGLHTLTLFGLHTPAGLFAADPVGTREEAVRRVVAKLDAQLEEPLADCLATDAEGRPCLQAASPLDVEASLAMPGGHIFHGDLAWPVADEAHPAGTWGAATAHPRVVSASSGGTVRGGAVSGLGGYAAARHLLG
ncbi:phytoene desaturase family protein [Klenkia taihuensis]|uniref:Pyridine nucleotide-disulfide oxidoreductase domain-containing protein 2 n=1 Tax=Klenkia taihuensis TaxID=1225127 RepID=A0A1I1I7D7_9ACTN|nr:NAD(P)/FAD-dependent oxidoreductase [Klenkia taihuensis]GHE08795.1 oxidoreductase [Klenkia taihuensis]SFC32001.1 Phytoene dehydrogenase-related protein [Klenkia taihuensis]